MNEFCHHNREINIISPLLLFHKVSYLIYITIFQGAAVALSSFVLCKLCIYHHHHHHHHHLCWARAVKHGGHGTNELLESSNLVATVMVIIS